MHLTRRMNHCASGMINYEELCLIQIQDLAQFLRDSHFIKTVCRWELLFVAQLQKFFRISLNIARAVDWQAHWRCAEDICYKSKMLSIPGVKVGARTGGHGQLYQAERLRLHGYFEHGRCEIGPPRFQHVYPLVLSDTDFKRKLVQGAECSPVSRDHFDTNAQSAGI